MAAGAIRHGSCQDHREITGEKEGQLRVVCGCDTARGWFSHSHPGPPLSASETISAAGERVGPCPDNGIPMSRHQEAETRWLPVTSRRALSQSRQGRSFWLGWAISIVL
jgi:hypothetical protein